MEELGGGDRATSAHRRCDRCPVRDDERKWQLAGRVGMCDRATDCPAVAGDRVADVWEDGGECGMRAQPLVGLPDRRSHREHAALVTNVGKIECTIDVDQDARTEESHVQRRDEALTAGQDFRVVAGLRRAREAASSSDSGRTYSNGAGFTLGGAPTHGRG